MTAIFPHLLLGGVLLLIALICVGIPYIESFLPEEDREKEGDFKRFETKEANSGSPVPTLPVVELASETEQPGVFEEVPVQEEPIPLAA